MVDHSKSDRPNILIIYPDQLRADAMGCAGNTVVKTPHFDRLANEGVRFTNAFTSYPVCCPFRASLLTGKYAHSNGMFCNHIPVDTDQTFLAPVLKSVGYDTGFVGKWHLDGGTHPGFVPPGERRLGFDYFVGFNRGHHYMNSVYYRETDEPIVSRRFEPDYQTEHMLEYLQARKQSEDGNPFFAYLCIGAPHYPNSMPAQWRNLYPPGSVVLPPDVPNPELQIATQKWKLEHDCAGDEDALDSSKAAKGKGHFESETEDEIRTFIAQYYGMVSNVDHNVGRILDYLDASGMAENTVVLLLSDHGDMFGQHGSFCGIKRSFHKASMQVPLIVRYPERFTAGRKVEGLIDVAIDTMPTLLELCGVEIPADVQGTSYLACLDGSAKATRETVNYEIIKQTNGKGAGGYLPVPERGIRTRQWLYVTKQHMPVCLFDLKNDPEELNNLVHQEDYELLICKFNEAIENHMGETGDSWDLEANWPPANLVNKAQVKKFYDDLTAAGANVGS